MSKLFKYISIFLLVAGMVAAAWYIYKKKFSQTESITESSQNMSVDTTVQQSGTEISGINLREILGIPDETEFEVTDSSSAEQLIIAGLYKQANEKDTTIKVNRKNKIMNLIERSKLIFSKEMPVTLKSQTMFLQENFNVQFWTNAFFQPVYYVNSRNEIQLFGINYSDSLKLTLEERVLRVEVPGKYIRASLYE